MPRLLLSFLTVVLLLSQQGCGKDADDPALASFKQGSVSQSELKKVFTSLPDQVREIALRQKKEFLESYAIEKILAIEARNKGLDKEEEVEALIQQATKKILVAKLIESEVDEKINISEKDKKEYYKEHQDDFMNPFRLRASHILVRSRDEADKVLEEIASGEKFSELAKRYSMDPTSTQGGDLGYFEKGQLLPEIEEAAFTLAKDEVSDPIQTSFGFHLIQVTDVVESELKDYESVEKEIEARLLVDERSRRFKELTDKVKLDAKLSIDEELLSEFSLQENTPS